MSVKVSTWVWQHAPAQGNGLLVLLALADQADDDGVAWPSQTYLATKTRLSESTVRRRLDELESEGTVVAEVRSGQSNRYRIACTPPQNDTPVKMTPLSEVNRGGVHLAEQGPLSAVTDRNTKNRQETPERAKRASKVPKNFVITDAMRAWAAKEVPLVDVDAKLGEWQDYWRGRGSVQKDWVATWRNGMRKQQQFAERDRPRTPAPRQGMSLDEMRRRREEAMRRG